MKKLFSLLSVIILFITGDLKAQDTTNCGIVIDGVRIDKMDSWAFTEMNAVFPFKDDWKSFDIVKIYVTWTCLNCNNFKQEKFDYLKTQSIVAGDATVRDIELTKKDLETDFEGAQYLVVYLSRKENKGTPENTEARQDLMSLRINSKDNPNDSDNHRAAFVLSAYGFSITGYKQYVDNYGVIQNVPIYDSGRLLYGYVSPSWKLCTNYYTTKKDWTMPLTNETIDVEGKSSCTPIDFNQPYNPSGKKWNFQVETANYRTDMGIVKKGQTGNPAPTTTTTTASTTSTTTKKSTVATTPYSEKHANGKIKVQGQKNKSGNQEGTWKYFDENGKLERMENYVNGIADGEWKYYDEGKLTKTEIYKAGELISTKEE